MSLLINHFYRFGEFTLDADQKVLLRQGKPLLLAPKVLETLLTFVQNGGRIVEKEELMTRVWPDTVVEESNLTYTIVQLRKTLGDDAPNQRRALKHKELWVIRSKIDRLTTAAPHGLAALR